MLSRRGLLAAGRRFRCTRALLFDGGGSDSGLPAEAGKRLTQTFPRNEKEPAEAKSTSLMVNGHNEAIYSAVGAKDVSEKLNIMSTTQFSRQPCRGIKAYK
jgi:hypothetical protein